MLFELFKVPILWLNNMKINMLLLINKIWKSHYFYLLYKKIEDIKRFLGF